jgi:hypothetical protein
LSGSSAAGGGVGGVVDIDTGSKNVVRQITEPDIRNYSHSNDSIQDSAILQLIRT